MNRLNHARTTQGSQILSDYGYALDLNGNRTRQSVYGAWSPVYGYNSADERVSSNGSPIDGYDANGNLTLNDAGAEVGYNAQNQMSSFTPRGPAGHRPRLCRP